MFYSALPTVSSIKWLVHLQVLPDPLGNKALKTYLCPSILITRYYQNPLSQTCLTQRFSIFYVTKTGCEVAAWSKVELNQVICNIYCSFSQRTSSKSTCSGKWLLSCFNNKGQYTFWKWEILPALFTQLYLFSPFSYCFNEYNLVSAQFKQCLLLVSQEFIITVSIKW